MVDASPRQSNRALALLIVASFLPFAAAVVIRLGLGNTPYETTDSLGRTMGFNDLLYAEHYRIIVGNFRPFHLFSIEYWYEWLLLAAQVTGVILLLRSSTTTSRSTRWYFLLQWLVFPFGMFFMVFAPVMVFGFLHGQRADRESFVDVPFVLVVGQGSWLWVSTFIAIAMKGPGLGPGIAVRKALLLTKEWLHGGARKNTPKTVIQSE